MMSGEPVGVYMVDDETLDLTLMARAIPWADLGIVLVGMSGNARSALEYLREDERVELLLLDIQMPGYTGLTLYEAIAKDRPELRVVYISGHEEFEYARKALELGALGYLLKPLERKALLTTLGRARDVILSLRAQRPQEPSTLVERMIQITTTRLQEGVDLKRIAMELFYSPNYLSAAFKAETGENYSVYLARLRVTRGEKLLRDTRLTVQEIAHMLGYTSSVYFIQFFREQCGMTPGAYRRLHGIDASDRNESQPQ